jgi:hypothetical protein
MLVPFRLFSSLLLLTASLFAQVGRDVAVRPSGPGERTERRLALVVGCNDYETLSPLRCAERDADDVGRELEQIGFSVVRMRVGGAVGETKPLSSGAILNQVENLCRLADPDTVLFFFFSGHGFELADGRVFLCPFGADRKQLPSTALDLDAVRDRFQDTGCKQSVLIIDMCRKRNDKSADDTGPSLARYAEARGSIMLFSTWAGTLSYEPDSGMQDESGNTIENGLFTHYLLRGLRGEADTGRRARTDRIVTFREVADYTTDGLAELSIKYGHVRQQPHLFWNGSSTDLPLRQLTATEPGQPAQPTDESLEDDIREWLRHVTLGDTTPFYDSRAPGRYEAWMRFAQLGNLRAQGFVGRCLMEGLGVEKDPVAGHRWIAKSAASNDPHALNTLAINYLSGTGTPVDMARYTRLVQQAADAGAPLAMTNLADSYRWGQNGFAVDRPRAMGLYERAAALGSTRAMRRLASFHADTGTGAKPDAALAEQWLRRAADAGDWRAKAQRMAPTLASQLMAAVGPDAERPAALAVLAETAQEIEGMPMVGVLTLLDHEQVRLASDQLNTDQARQAKSLYVRMLDRLIATYRREGLLARRDHLATFTNLTVDVVKAWIADGDYRRVAGLWRDAFGGIDVRSCIDGEIESLVSHANFGVMAMVRLDRQAEAFRLLDDIVAAAESVLELRPWEWYVRSNLQATFFDVAEACRAVGAGTRQQELLRRGWREILWIDGKEELLAKYKVLSPRGVAPPDVEEGDRGAFEKRPMRRWTVPVDFSGKKHPFFIYVQDGKRALRLIQDQIRWVEEYRGGKFPVEVEESFRRLFAIAQENKVSFVDLCVYAFDEANKGEKSGK